MRITPSCAICRAFICVLVASSLVSARERKPEPPPRSLTVLLQFDQPHSSAWVNAMRRELRHLLAPAGLNVELAFSATPSSGPYFEQLTMFQMRGSCTMNAPGIKNWDGGGPLAFTYVSDGRVLHFGAVECDRVRTSLQQAVGSANGNEHETEFGSALARVVAHEIYHMMTGSEQHTRAGITKEVFSPRELSDMEFFLSADARNSLLGGTDESR